MAEGGLVVKIDGKDVGACYAVTFDYDIKPVPGPANLIHYQEIWHNCPRC